MAFAAKPPGRWSPSRCRTSASRACNASSRAPSSRPAGARGDDLQRRKGAAAIRALFALGLFKDVRLEATGNVLVVVVEERPTIADGRICRHQGIRQGHLKKAMRDVGLAEGRPFDKALADRAEQELKRQYINKQPVWRRGGDHRHADRAQPCEPDLHGHRGRAAKIKDIRIVGNQAFSESTLKGLFDQDTGGWMSWYTKSDRYARQAQCRPGDAALVLPGARLPGVPHRLHAGRHLAGQAGHHHHHQRHRGRALRRLGRQARGNYLDRDDEFKSLITIQPRRALQRRQRGRNHQGLHRPLRQLRFAFARSRPCPRSTA